MSPKKSSPKMRVSVIHVEGDIYRYEVVMNDRKLTDTFNASGMKQHIKNLDKKSLTYEIWSAVLAKLSKKEDSQDERNDDQAGG